MSICCCICCTRNSIGLSSKPEPKGARGLGGLEGPLLRYIEHYRIDDGCHETRWRNDRMEDGMLGWTGKLGWIPLLQPRQNTVFRECYAFVFLFCSSEIQLPESLYDGSPFELIRSLRCCVIDVIDKSTIRGEEDSSVSGSGIRL